MAVKKKSGKPEEEHRSPVTQVVEVVEDGIESVIHSDILEDSSMEDPQTQTEDEKRRVLVDELFQKKTDEPQAEVVTPEISVHRRPSSSRRSIMMWAIVIVVASLIAGGIILAVSGGSVVLPTLMSTPTPTVTSTPVPTPTPDVSALDRSTLAVQVLNGSGTPGVAGTMKEFLEEKGYTVKNTGNAQTYDYETTQIFVKAKSKAYLTLLEEDLKESYVLGSSSSTLEDDVTYDVRIIVGKE